MDSAKKVASTVTLLYQDYGIKKRIRYIKVSIFKILQRHRAPVASMVNALV